MEHAEPRARVSIQRGVPRRVAGRLDHSSSLRHRRRRRVRRRELFHRFQRLARHLLGRLHARARAWSDTFRAGSIPPPRCVWFLFAAGDAEDAARMSARSASPAPRSTAPERCDAPPARITVRSREMPAR